MGTLRFLQVSGLCFGRECPDGLGAGERRRLDAVSTAWARSGADVILIAGGLFDREQARPGVINSVLKELSVLGAVYLCPGAEDYLSPLSPYSRLGRARRGLEPLPENIAVFGAEFQTLFVPGRSDVAVSGRGAGTRAENPADVWAECRRADGAEVSFLVLGAVPPPAGGEILGGRFTYAALRADARAETPVCHEVRDGLGNLRAAAGRGLTGEIVDGSVTVTPFPLP